MLSLDVMSSNASPRVYRQRRGSGTSSPQRQTARDSVRTGECLPDCVIKFKTRTGNSLLREFLAAAPCEPEV